jgi:hypothetical protein
MAVSRYHGLGPASLNYSVAATLEYTSKVPRNPNNTQRPDYAKILSDINICNYMLQDGVNEVWIFAYQSSALNQIDESKMSGPNGDVSNELQHDNLPICGRTYTVYTFNYGRTLAEAMESHSHQLEAELNHVNPGLFSLFESNDLSNPGQGSYNCGTVHDPPNAGFEHDYGDVNGVLSFCQEFQASGGPDFVSCINWGSCSGNIDTDEPHYLTWWMQNFPGLGNQATYQGHTMRNWWDVHGDWDLFMWRGGSLLN